MGICARSGAAGLAWAFVAACEFGSSGQGGAPGQRPPPDTTGPDSTGTSDRPGLEDDTRGEGEGTAGGGDASTSLGPPPMTDGPGETGSESSDTGVRVLPTDCAQILADDPLATSGPHVIEPPGATGPVEVWCDMVTDGGGWTRFWWWTPGTWNPAVTDVLESPFGACAVDAPYCFGRLPALKEDETSIYAFDPQGPTKYRWDFDSQNATAHAAWQAFAEHTQIPAGQVQHGVEWAPMPLEGSPPPEAAQDSFMYRTEHGVASILLDDDNCDCETSLQMGHGMCYAGWGTGSSPENSFGVDRLHNPGAENGPRPEYHLELYWR
jgi:hypothetical protein